MIQLNIRISKGWSDDEIRRRITAIILDFSPEGMEQAAFQRGYKEGYAAGHGAGVQEGYYEAKTFVEIPNMRDPLGLLKTKPSREPGSGGLG